MPLTHQEMTFSLGGLYTAMRPSALQFHQALWNDATDVTWQNFSSVYDAMYAQCSNLSGSSFPLVDAPQVIFCRDGVNNYFNQGIAARMFGIPPYNLYLASSAAVDYRLSLYGQACANNAQKQLENLCG